MKLGNILFLLAGLNILVFALSIFFKNTTFFNKFTDFNLISIHSFYLIPLTLLLLVAGAIVSIIEASSDIITSQNKSSTKAGSLTEKKYTLKENIRFILLIVLVGVVMTSLIAFFLFG